ncbi:MAG: hypothetical protein AAB791_02435 [Patescibacteria group bacterium]
MAKKIKTKAETKIDGTRISAFTGMILLASMVIGAFLTAIFTR